MQALAHEKQAFCINCSTAAAAESQVTFAWDAVGKATANFKSICNHIEQGFRGRSDMKTCKWREHGHVYSYSIQLSI